MKVMQLDFEKNEIELSILEKLYRQRERIFGKLSKKLSKGKR